MKRSSIVIAILGYLAYLPGWVAAAKVLKYSVTRALPDNAQLPALSQRQGTTLESLSNDFISYAYYTDIEVRTPAQKLLLMLDTRNSDIWVTDESTPPCSSGSCRTPYKKTSSNIFHKLMRYHFINTDNSTIYSQSKYITNYIYS